MNNITQLEKELQNKAWFHAYIFIGDTLATENAIDLLVKTRDVKKEDISVIESSLEIGKKGEIKVEQVRGLVHDISLSPNGLLRVGVIRDCDHLGYASANILLKILEEPPKHACFVLTSKTANIISTIYSRCRVYKFVTHPGTCEIDNISELLSGNLSKSFSKIEEIVRENQIDLFLSNLHEKFRQEMLKDRSFAFLLEEVYKVKKRINNNANPKLALENLILKIREVV